MAEQGKALGVAMSRPQLDAITVSETADFQGHVKVGGATTDKISFYGVTPIVQPSGDGQAAVSESAIAAIADSALATVSGTAAVSVSLNDGYAFNQTQANNLLTLAAELKARVSSLTTFANEVKARDSSLTTLSNALRSALVNLGAIAGA